MNKDQFFQFELCLLSYPTATGPDDDRDKANKRRAEIIMAYSIIEHGKRTSRDMSIRELQNAAADIAPENKPIGIRRNEREHLEYAFGQKNLGITKGHAPTACQNHTDASGYVRSYTAKHGRDAVCRLRDDLLFKARDGGMKWRDFSTLAAVYSIIGGKPFPVLLYRSQIRARQLGFKSAAIMESVIADRPDLGPPLTEKQIRYTLDSLECAGWFARVQGSKRKVYFSNRLTREQMIEGLEKSAKAQGRAKLHRRQDAGIMARLQELKSGGKA